MLYAVILSFAFPVAWALYILIAQRELAKYIPLFLVSSFFSVVASSVVQVLTQPIFSRLLIFSGGAAALALHSFVQAGLIEETFKAALFYFALRRVFYDERELYGISESVAFFFAIFSGLLFASFETLSQALYTSLGSSAARLFTAHILHPVALLVSASGAYFGKSHIAGYILPFIAAMLMHGFYNLAVVAGGIVAAVLCVVLELALTAGFWALIFSRDYSYLGKRRPASGEQPKGGGESQ